MPNVQYNEGMIEINTSLTFEQRRILKCVASTFAGKLKSTGLGCVPTLKEEYQEHRKGAHYTAPTTPDDFAIKHEHILEVFNALFSLDWQQAKKYLTINYQYFESST